MSSPPRGLRARLGRFLDDQRLRVSRAEALPQLAVLGVACGILAALVMIAFRMIIELSQAALLPPGGPENYEALPPEVRLLLPIAGALAVAAIFQPLPELVRHVGVVHVMERLAYHQGRLPLRNAILQSSSALPWQSFAACRWGVRTLPFISASERERCRPASRAAQ